MFEVLSAADHLQVKSVVKLCCDFLLIQCIQLRFDVETYCRVWTIADRHGLKDLQEAAEHEIASKFKDVCESEEFLTHIGADQWPRWRSVMVFYRPVTFALLSISTYQS